MKRKKKKVKERHIDEKQQRSIEHTRIGSLINYQQRNLRKKKKEKRKKKKEKRKEKRKKKREKRKEKRKN